MYFTEGCLPLGLTDNVQIDTRKPYAVSTLLCNGMMALWNCNQTSASL